MCRTANWDWEVGRKTVVASLLPLDGHQWQEEPYASEDGEHLAAVVCLGDGEFSLRTNDDVWEETFEKAWLPRFSPNGKLTALVQQDMAWSLAVDGELLGEPCEYVWDTKFAGDAIATMAKVDGKYGVCLNGKMWDTCFENANQYTVSNNGTHTAAVVQVKPLGQADIEGFKRGVYSLALDGNVWKGPYINVWTPVFDAHELRVAAQVRTGVHQYTIAEDDAPWPNTFSQVWEPVFHPEGKYVAAPVRTGGKWGVARGGALSWKPRYVQCLKLQFSRDGHKLWAIVATAYGQFTAACNDVPWKSTFPVVTDLVVDASGERAACIASNHNTLFRIVVDGSPWGETMDMAWPPVFSPDGSKVAALVEKGGKHHIMVDGKAYERSFDHAWPPHFNEDGSKVLIRAVEDNSYVRIVADTSRF